MPGIKMKLTGQTSTNLQQFKGLRFSVWFYWTPKWHPNSFFIIQYENKPNLSIEKNIYFCGFGNLRYAVLFFKEMITTSRLNCYTTYTN